MRLATTAMATAASIMLIGSAYAIDYKDIQGKWCGSTATYVFERDLLTVFFRNSTPTKEYKIDKYEWRADSFILNWRDAKNEAVHTDFGEFSADKKNMVQLATEAGPRRPFNRC